MMKLFKKKAFVSDKKRQAKAFDVLSNIENFVSVAFMQSNNSNNI